MLHAIVEEYTLAIGIYTTIGALQIIIDRARHNARTVRYAGTLDDTRSELHQCGRLHSDILHETHHQRVIAQAQLQKYIKI